VQLGQKSFESHPTVKRCHALRRFVTPFTLRCVKGLAPLLRPRRACETQLPMNQLLVEYSDLPSPMVEAKSSSPLHLESVDGHLGTVRGHTRSDGWRRNERTSMGVGRGIYLRGSDSFGRSLRG